MPRQNKLDASHTTIRIKRETRDQLLKIKASDVERMAETIDRILEEIKKNKVKLQSKKRKVRV